jgi:site-specific DNA-cytosine methylase
LSETTCVDVFAGAGGLSLGLKRAGFRIIRVVEREEICVQTLNQNRRALGLKDEVEQTDATTLSWSELAGRVDLVAAGVPCQPFSFGGRSEGHGDGRNAFPEIIRAVREIQPRAILIENVKGFASETFLTYFEYVIRQIEMPDIKRKHGESWRSHRLRLNRALPSYARAGGLAYRVRTEVLQAADYGVSQLRERLFIVGLRNDVDQTWSRPRSNRSEDRLLHDQYISGEYWKAHRLKQPSTPADLLRRLRKMEPTPPSGYPWRTLRISLESLGEPAAVDDETRRHFLRGGATKYAGHDGSALDWPAKTIKAGVHGVPGGENMLCYSNGRVRYFTIREAARLQSFPDSYQFAGSWTDAYRQLGNAVPVRLGEVVAGSVKAILDQANSRRPQALVTMLRRVAP